MKRSLLHIAFTSITALGLISQAPAQNSMRMPDPLANLKPSEVQGLKDQAAGFFNASQPAIAKAAKSTVAISYRHSRISYGTVVLTPGATHPVILTKWSEVKNARAQLVVTTPEGKQHPAKVSGVYPEHDLALLSIEGSDTKLTPLDLTAAARPELGNFVVLARPDGKVEGFGVVSVKERSLRESDKAYLGVMMDFASAGKDGVPLKQVMPDSAADRAGLRDGDVIISVDQTAITGAMEMRNLLQRLVPGSKINISYRRGVVEKTATVQLGSRADDEDIRRVPRERMERMQRMGTVPSHVRSNFPSVIQTDMPIAPYDTGAPVADLDGNIVGITIARGSRIKTYVIPTSTIQKVLATKPQPVDNALASGNNTEDPRYAPRYGRNSRNLYPENSRVAPRAVPADEEDTIGKVRRLLEETRRNNDENSENLRKIEDALRKMRADQENGR
ncbi:MAG: PDZ domain-containing protein [Akkermansiaceae bacterium]|nr:PDZ domain-containing protein [Akkermansiaceae bacterium]